MVFSSMFEVTIVSGKISAWWWMVHTCNTCQRRPEFVGEPVRFGSEPYLEGICFSLSQFLICEMSDATVTCIFKISQLYFLPDQVMNFVLIQPLAYSNIFEVRSGKISARWWMDHTCTCTPCRYLGHLCRGSSFDSGPSHIGERFFFFRSKFLICG
jgi:hypothetical protein